MVRRIGRLLQTRPRGADGSAGAAQVGEARQLLLDVGQLGHARTLRGGATATPAGAALALLALAVLGDLLGAEAAHALHEPLHLLELGDELADVGRLHARAPGDA